ncbi:autotransporter outer membrane beta-barrel domain-containing protein [Erwinia sp. 9145]|uniref:autotransporter outer membrane beta-barrel domain-containing protein n=1 Tax=Erwinia sp. 9145 TaxID=1500895 RepID=UPI0005509976|nr:autotransporter outer membrane beta-barrel domain-containing protein [Erwinia sp. 9145]
MFKFHPVFISLVTACGIIAPASSLSATLKPFTPEFNDNRAGVFCVCNGSTQTLHGNQHFAPGQDGGGSIPIGVLLHTGRIISDDLVIGADRLDLGPQNYIINIPEENGSANNTLSVYNSAAINALARIDENTVLPNFFNVNDGQYIDSRVAQVSNGTINVDIGQRGASTTAATNGWTMAAKQSDLFAARGTGTMNWNSANRIGFFGAYTPYTYNLGYWVDNVVTWQDEFTVRTRDNTVTAFTIRSVGELQKYNDWLIAQLQHGNLGADSYNGELNKAFAIRSDVIAYVIDADEFYDEITQPIGERVVLSADGPGAKVTIGRQGTLEVVNAIGGAMRASNGASTRIDGKLASTSSEALVLLNGSRGVNNGVINGGFFNRASGRGVDPTTVGSGSTAVFAADGSRFVNNGVINGSDNSTAVVLNNASGINKGVINVGTTENRGGASAGVAMNDDSASFINAASGLIYLGRTPQNYVTDPTSDIAIAHSSGIVQHYNSSAINNGRIIIGSKVQDGVAMRVSDGPTAQTLNNGVITVNGKGNTGMLAVNSGSGGQVGNAGIINVNGKNNTGMGVIATEGNSASAWSTGVINVAGGSRRQPDQGVTVTGRQASFYQNGTLNLTGRHAVGVDVREGATLNTGDTASVIFHKPDQTGYQAANYAFVNSAGGSYNVTTDRSTLYHLSSGTIFNPQTAANVTLSGANTTGIFADGWGNGLYGTTLYGTDNYIVNGKGATAIRAQEGADVTITSPIVLNGNNTTGAVGKYGAGRLASTAPVTGGGKNAVAFDIGDGITFATTPAGTVDLTGRNSTGIRVKGGSAIFNHALINVPAGIGMDISDGEARYFPEESRLTAGGVAAVRVGNAGSLTIYGDTAEGAYPLSSIDATGNADTLLLTKGASALTASDIQLTGSQGGTVINNRAETSNISLKNVRIEVNNGIGIRTATPIDANGSVYAVVVGDQATGYAFGNEDGSVTHSDLIIPAGYNIFTYGAATGVRANTTGRVIADGLIYINDANGGSAIVTSTASEVINRGAIVALSVTSPVIDLRGGQSVFINQGDIFAPYPETVVVAGGASNDQVALVGGSVVGEVNTGNGTDVVELSGGTFNGSLTLGSGKNNVATVSRVSLANTRHITTAGGEGSTLNFSNITAQGGSFADGDDLRRGVNLGAGWSTLNFYNTDWTLTDNLKLAHSTINIDAGSTLYVGNNVNPQLSGATEDSLVVNNAGTLDLTNGGAPGSTLTINGDLVSSGGRVIVHSRVDETSAQSDSLRVNGNVSGTTLLNATLTGGALSDRNNNGVTEASEGVSVAQVTGNASPASFALQGGYATNGAWQYGLYSFAPGGGSTLRDYRLANTFVCEDGSLCQPQTAGGNRAVRPAVVPQLPSYLSAPIGLAYYTLAVTDDLHKRLGELRDARRESADSSGEMFIRYLGSNQKYKSNADLRHYGYDFDLDYNAVQLGGNLVRLDGPQDSLRGGLAFTRGNTRIRPHAADGYSSTDVDSDSLALYATWQRDSGFYLDGALAHDWHRGDTDIARQKEVATLKGQGWSASLESGYPWQLGNGVRLEPQAQVMYLHLRMDDVTDKDRTHVAWDDYDQTIGRLGARLDRTWRDDANRQYTPYLRTNYFRGWGGTAKMRVSADDSSSQDFNSGKFGQMWDAGVGGTTTFKNGVALYAEADYRQEIDGNGTKGWRYNAGVRWTF